MHYFNILSLQWFAEGGGDGSAAGSTGAPAAAPAAQETGVKTADDPGRQRLRELGVPESKLRKNRAYGKSAAQRPAAQPSSVAASAETEPTGGSTPDADKTGRMTWEQIKQDPEYSKALKDEMSATVQSRLKSSKAAEANLTALAPAIEMLAKKYGMDPQNLSHADLSKAILDDDAMYDDKAIEMGVSRETAKRLEQYEAEKNQQERAQKKSLRAEIYRKHYDSLVQQAADLAQKYPGIDLNKELENPTFARLTSPGSGLSVEDAYVAVHRKEIVAAAGQQAQQQLSNALQSQQQRPRETGSSATPSVPNIDYRHMSSAQRESVKQQIRMAAAQGRKLRPGDIRLG